jgi:hypothetical protein
MGLLGRCGDPRRSPPSRGVSAVNASLGISACRELGGISSSGPSKYEFDVKRSKRWAARVLICSRSVVWFRSLYVEVTGIDFFIAVASFFKFSLCHRHSI